MPTDLLRHWRRLAVPAWLVLVLSAALVAETASPRVPGIDDLLALRTLGGAQISPDGKWVVYTVTTSDLDEDAFVTHLWVVPVAGGAPYQLTRGSKSVGSARWSPDSRWIAFTSTRAGDKSQVFAIRPDGGEAVQFTKAETSVSGFEWSPDGKQIAFAAPEKESAERKGRKDHLGDFDVVRRDYAHTHVWTIDVPAALDAPQAGRQRTRGTEFSVGDAAWSPDGTKLAFSASRNPDLVQGHTSDIYVLDLGSDSVRKIVDLAGPDSNPRWSPDGQQLVFASSMGRADFFHANRRLALVDAAGGSPRSLTDGFDEQPALIDWRSDGIYFSGLAKTSSHMFRLDPASGRHTRVTAPETLIGFSFTLSDDGETLAFVRVSPTEMAEVVVTPLAAFAPRRLTAMSDQLASLTLGKREVIRWKSTDGAEIEGVLVKPANFDPATKYPLLVVIHGGPTGIDLPTAIDTRYYPIDAWVGRGAVVLKVNYRGSAGYGEKFRQLNVRNLGVGDAWDVVSGVDHLIAQGFVDPKRVGSMGWSQGGYISAFLTTSTTRFAAISVGAGISNWATYYYNTDITPFTVQYLGDDPADDPEIYRKTSPMSYIAQAKTPTLIQHGENDRRVPIPNAYELRQGLEDRGVPVEMVVYKGFGHGITKPKAMRAVMRHNLEWFNHYLWGDPAPNLTTPEVPVKEKAGEEKTSGK